MSRDQTSWNSSLEHAPSSDASLFMTCGLFSAGLHVSLVYPASLEHAVLVYVSPPSMVQDLLAGSIVIIVVDQGHETMLAVPVAS